jgi:hypothetical protein
MKDIRSKKLAGRPPRHGRNSLRLTLRELGINERKVEEAPAEATPGPGSHQDASIEGDEPNPLDKEDTPPWQERRVWLRGAAGRGFQELCAKCERPCKVFCSVGNLASSFICNDFMVQIKKEGCYDADAV